MDRSDPGGIADADSDRALSRAIAGLYALAPTPFRLLQTYRPYLAPFADLIAAVPPGATVLDVGCGAGLFLNLLAARGRIVAGHGIDASAPAITAAQAAAAAAGHDARVRFEHRPVQAGLPDGPAPGGDWPVISLIDVIHHLPSSGQRDAVRAIAAKVAPGGRLILRDPVRRPYWRNVANMAHDLVLARQVVHARDPETVAGWIADMGFMRPAIRGDTRLWYGYWMMTCDRP